MSVNSREPPSLGLVTMRNRQPKVLSVISRLATGGAESLLYYVHKHLRSNGYDNFAICTLTDEGGFYKKAREDNLPVISLGLSSSYDPRALPRLISVIKKGSFNIIHSHLSSACLYSFLASFFIRNMKLIHTTHGIDTEEVERSSAVTRLRYRFFISRIDKIVAVSNSTRDKYIALSRISGDKVVVVPNAIESNEWKSDVDVKRKRIELGIEDSIPVFLAVGRVCEPKGYDTLLKAAGILRDRNQIYKLLIAGDGPLWDQMIELRDALGLQTEVSFLGRRNDIAELLQVADIFVQSSNREGMPISVIEAMICGKPIVATAVDGTCDLIRNGADGFLVPPKDPSAFAMAVIRMLDDSAIRLRFGGNARKHAHEEFTMDIMVQRLIKLYEELLHD